MSSTIYNLLGSAFAAAEKKTISKKAITKTSTQEQNILLSAYPIILNPDDYENALSTANPNGDLIPLWRFRQLVDPLPQYSDVYLPSINSTEETYSMIINGASAEAGNSFVDSIISNSQKNLHLTTFSNMDGTTGSWCPVYAVPDDWYTITNNNKEVNLNLKTTANTKSVKPDQQLAWKIIHTDNSVSTMSLDTNSKINTAKVNYKMVSLHRPWLNAMIFDTDGWYLQGQKMGFCSSGKNDGKGIIPLIPSSIIIGTDVTIDANWSTKDMQIINKAKATKQQLSLGPLLVNAGDTATKIHVIGWSMSQIPFSPQISG